MDYGIVKDLQNGDEKAFEEIYKETNKKAYIIAKSFLHNDSDADDVLQEAYIVMYEKIGTLQDVNKVQSWFDRIVVNKCKDYIKKRDRANVVSGEEVDEIVEQFEDIREEFRPELSVDYTETKKVIQSLLGELNEEQKQCIILYFYEGLNSREIADCLECSENTVKSRLRYAKKYLADRISYMERNGIKIRSVSVMPFIVWMLREQEAKANTGDIYDKIVSSMRKSNKLIYDKSIARLCKRKLTKDMTLNMSKKSNCNQNG